jgi:trehalose synthase
LTPSLQSYADAAGPEVIDHLRQLARSLKGARVVHVNSTPVGGGVAEILTRLVPLKKELGIETSWQTIEGSPDFFAVTKAFHNGLQGNAVEVPRRLLDLYVEVNRENARRLGSVLRRADFVFVHDPQPAALLKFIEDRQGRWIWRCHIDVSRPHRPIWKFLREFVRPYDASIFSLAAFAQPLPHPQYLIPPSLDPLSEKNARLEPAEIAETAARFGLDAGRPVLIQVSRFDRFKDPVGVIRAYRLVRPHVPVQLVLAGGTATDDPEGDAVLAEVREAAGDDPDIHILHLPPDAHRVINALQRRADLVLQKSVREGFGLTVSEALWKGKPVIGGATGGIPLQILDGINGYLVSSAEGAAFRTRFLLNHPEVAQEMGRRGVEMVRQNFLLTRHLREYLMVLHCVRDPARRVIEIG